MNGAPRTARLAGLGLLALLIVSLANVGLLDPARVARGAANIGLFTTSMFPPDSRVVDTVAGAMLETLQIAFIGTALGAALALPLALLATRTLFGLGIAGPTRLVLAFVRTIPALLWGIVFVVAFGLGAAAGSLGIALYSLGYMGKLFYEMFEGVDSEVLEAVRSVGCTRLQLAQYALLPEAANNVVAQVLFMFEYNVRASAIMGFVGAGGIGYYMLGYIQMLRYDALLTSVLVTLVVVVGIDYGSARLRSLFLPQAHQAPA